MPSVSCRRVRPRHGDARIERKFPMAESTGNKRLGTAARPDVDGNAASARVPPDGRDHVPHALFLQDAGPRAQRQEVHASGADRRQTHPPPRRQPRRRRPPKRPRPPRLPPRRSPKRKPEPTFVINTDLFRIAFSNQGANVRSWQLKKSLAEGKPLELVNTAAAVEDPYPFSLYMPEHQGARQEAEWGGVSEERRSRRAGRDLRLFRRPHRRAQDFPLPEGQLPGAGHERGLDRWATGRQHARMARRLRRFYPAESRRQPEDYLFRPRREQPEGADGKRRQERARYRERHLLVCRNRGRLLHCRLPARRQRHHAGGHVLRHHAHAA